MPGLTLAQAEAQLAAWLAASAAAAAGQRYKIGARELERADAAEIRQQIDYWQAKVTEFAANPAGGVRFQLGVPT